jgi:Fusaric acid resistance protein family
MSQADGWTPGSPQTGSLAARRVAGALRSVGPPLLFGLRLWASVSLALYVAFWLELDNPFWAGTTAAIVCHPQLGASLRKGWYRMIGTLVGAVAIVVLTACFPQARAPFLVALALWCAACALVATLLHNFASYSAALAGYTAAIIAADELGATGGPNADAVFLLAVYRASEICIGIVSAGIVLAGTDFGGAHRRLAALFAALSAEITGRAGTGAAALSFRLMPPLSPVFRTRRLLGLTLRDLRRLAKDRIPWTADVWEGRIYGRFAALPDAAEPLQRSQFLAALSVGNGIIQLRRIVRRLGLGSDLDASLEALARGNSAIAATRLPKSSLRAPSFDSPAGFAMTASFDPK